MSRRKVVEIANPEPVESPDTIEIEESPLMSTKDALEVALSAHSEEETLEPKVAQGQVEETLQEPETPKYQPPAEWDKEDKELFYQSTEAQQLAALKLHEKRQKTFHSIREEQEALKHQKQEMQWIKDLADQMTPFLKTRGDKEPAYNQLVKALKVVNHVDSDTKGAVAAILEARGLPVPKELLESDTAGDVRADTLTKENSDLQNRLNSIESELALRKRQEQLQPVFAALSEFESIKGADGKPKFPSYNGAGTSQQDLEFASNFGSLVRGDTEQSQFYINLKLRSNPNLTMLGLLEEAYKDCGGLVNPSGTTESDKTKIIKKSNRAASSVPGTGGQGTSSSPIKKLSRKEALALALEEAGQNE